MASSDQTHKVSNGDIKPQSGIVNSEQKYLQFAERLRAAAGSKAMNAAALARSLSITNGTMSRYWTGERLPPSDTLIEMAAVLGASPTWLIKGALSASLTDASDAEWVQVREYDLRALTDDDKGPAIDATAFRRDWLYRTIGTAGQSGRIWLARLLSAFPESDLARGALVFAQDIGEGDLAHHDLCLWARNGDIVTARYDLYYAAKGAVGDVQRAYIAQGAILPQPARIVTPAMIGHDDGQYTLIARILGTFLRGL